MRGSSWSILSSPCRGVEWARLGTVRRVAAVAAPFGVTERGEVVRVGAAESGQAASMGSTANVGSAC